eukprot:gene9915-2237_t
MKIESGEKPKDKQDSIEGDTGIIDLTKEPSIETKKTSENIKMGSEEVDILTEEILEKVEENIQDTSEKLKEQRGLKEDEFILKYVDEENINLTKGFYYFTIHFKPSDIYCLSPHKQEEFNLYVKNEKDEIIEIIENLVFVRAAEKELVLITTFCFSTKKFEQLSKVKFIFFKRVRPTKKGKKLFEKELTYPLSNEKLEVVPLSNQIILLENEKKYELPKEFKNVSFGYLLFLFGVITRNVKIVEILYKNDLLDLDETDEGGHKPIDWCSYFPVTNIFGYLNKKMINPLGRKVNDSFSKRTEWNKRIMEYLSNIKFGFGYNLITFVACNDQLIEIFEALLKKNIGTISDNLDSFGNNLFFWQDHHKSKTAKEFTMKKINEELEKVKREERIREQEIERQKIEEERKTRMRCFTNIKLEDKDDLLSQYEELSLVENADYRNGTLNITFKSQDALEAADSITADLQRKQPEVSTGFFGNLFKKMKDVFTADFDDMDKVTLLLKKKKVDILSVINSLNSLETNAYYWKLHEFELKEFIELNINKLADLFPLLLTLSNLGIVEDLVNELIFEFSITNYEMASHSFSNIYKIPLEKLKSKKNKSMKLRMAINFIDMVNCYGGKNDKMKLWYQFWYNENDYSLLDFKSIEPFFTKMFRVDVKECYYGGVIRSMIIRNDIESVHVMEIDEPELISSLVEKILLAEIQNLSCSILCKFRDYLPSKEHLIEIQKRIAISSSDDSLTLSNVFYNFPMKEDELTGCINSLIRDDIINSLIKITKCNSSFLNSFKDCDPGKISKLLTVLFIKNKNMWVMPENVQKLKDIEDNFGNELPIFYQIISQSLIDHHFNSRSLDFSVSCIKSFSPKKLQELSFFQILLLKKVIPLDVCSNFDTKKMKDVIKYYINIYEFEDVSDNVYDEFEVLRNKIEELVIESVLHLKKEVEDQNLSEEMLIKLQNNDDVLTLVLRAIENSIDFNLVHEQIQEFEDLKQRRRTIFILIDWLGYHDHRVKSNYSKRSSFGTLKESKEMINSIEKDIKESGVEIGNDQASIIQYFVKEDSILFNAILKFTCKNKYLTSDFTQISMNELINETISILKKFSSDKLTLNDIKTEGSEILKAIRKAQLEDKNRSLSKEISILLGYFESSEKNTISEEKLISALQYIDIMKLYPDVIKCFDLYHLENCKKHLQGFLIEDEEISVTEVDDYLKKVKELFNGLENYHIRFFSTVAYVKPLVNSLIDLSDFENRITILSNNEGTQHHATILDLKSCYPFLKLFFDKNVQFQTIIDTLLKSFKNEKDMNIIINSTLNAFHHNERIQYWFSQIDGLSMDNVKLSIEILNRGVYKSIYHENKKNCNLTIEYSWKNDGDILILDEERIVDLVRKAIFCHESAVEESDEKNLMKVFEISYKIADKANSKRNQLKYTGHPKYQTEQFEIGKNSVEDLNKCLKQLEYDLDEWNDSVNDTITKIPQILKLRKNQMIRLMNLINQQNISSYDFKEILSLVYVCYWDYFDDHLSFFSAITEKFISNSISKSNSEWLQKLTDLLVTVKQECELVGSCDQGNEPIKSVMVDASKFKSKEELVFSITNQVLEFSINLKCQCSQFFFCSSNLMEEIKWFNKRREMFPGMKYLIFNAEEELSKNDFILAETNSNSKLNSHYIFKNSLWMNTFSFLDNATFGSNQEDVKKIYKGYPKSLLNGGSLTTVVGDALCGKSRAISQFAKSEGQTLLKICVNEDFSGSYFIKKYKDMLNLGIQKIAIHFNVTASESISELDKLLMYIFFCGVWMDENSGETFVTNINNKLNIYVELPSNENSNYDLKNIAPVISIFTNEIKKITLESFEFEIDDKANYVANFIDLFQQNMLTRSNLMDANMRNISTQKSKIVLKNIFKLCPTRYHQVLFIEMMYERCLFINHSISQDVVVYPDSTLILQFKAFFNESKALVSESIGKKLTETPFTFFKEQSFYDEETMDPNIDLITSKDNSISELNSHIGMLCENNDSHSVHKILKQRNYVLTTDFAVKMTILNEKRKRGHNVIISGGTGVGKTELLHMFTEILNFNEDFKPQESLTRKFLNTIMNTSKLSNHEREAVGKNLIDFDNSLNLTYLILAIETLCTDSKDGSHARGEKLQIFSKQYIMEMSNALKKYDMLDINSLTMEVLEKKSKMETLTQFINLVKDIENSKPKGIFHQIMMHPGWTVSQLRNKFKSIIDEHHELKKRDKCKNLISLVFIDELNTSQCLGFLKEVMVDGSLDGEPIDKSIFFVGAINPQDKNISETEELTYIVNKLPISMEKIILDFGELSPFQQNQFVQFLFRSEFCSIKPFIQMDEKNTNLVTAECEKLILFCQIFVQTKQKQNKRIRVSIRDIMRFTQLYEFFSTKICLKYTSDDPLAVHWTNLIISIGLTYYFRLSSSNRNEFSKEFDNKLKELKAFNIKVKINGIYSYLLDENCVERVLSQQLTYFYDRVYESNAIPKGIADTRALKENLFCNFVCIQTKIPLLISGPPGTSKTLSYQIASRIKKIFDFAKTVNGANYQCTEYSTPEEIESVYNSRIDLYENLRARNDENEIVSVFLDESGLPKEKKHALKVIHYYLDHAKISSVLISNSILDAAKTNRTLHLQQEESTEEDLKCLAKGILRQKNIDGFIDGLISAYFKVNTIVKNIDPYLRKPLKSDSSKCDFFQLRDFVFLLRLLAETSNFSNENVYYCLQRHFNGVSVECFEEITNNFFNEFQKRDNSYSIPSKKKSHIDVLKESINRNYHSESSDPNQSSFRYTLLIDDGNVETSLRLLTSENILENDYEICSVSDFPNDDNLFSKSQEISKIKLAMEIGKTLILINSDSINTNFYDVFNRHFYDVKKEVDHKVEGTNEVVKKTITQYFANVAVGALSSQYPVHENFHIIVHIPKEKVKDAPLPFLNRFEKYQLGESHILDGKLSDLKKKIIFDALKEGVEDFVNTMLPQTFVGLTEKQTTASLMIQILKDSVDIPVIHNPFDSLPSYAKNVHKFENIDPLKRMKENIKQTNFKLLQLASPESIYSLRNVLPSNYLAEYLNHQEHFSFAKFVKEIGKSFLNPDSNFVDNKWIVFTRTSGQIVKLLTDKLMQESLFQFDDNLKISEYEIVSFDSFTKKKDCDIFIDKFVEENKKALLCIVDSKHATKSQLNYFRYKVDQMKTKEDPLILFLIQNSSQSEPYDVVYLNNWNYLYVDNFDNQKYFRGEMNPHFWFSYATNLSTLNNSKLMEELSSLYEEIIGELDFRNRKEKLLKREDITKKKFLENVNFKKIILSTFKKNWLDTQLNSILKDACDSIVSGNEISSILDLVYNGFETLLETVCKYYQNLVMQYPKEFQSFHESKTPYISSLILEETFTTKSSNFKNTTLQFDIPFSNVLIQKLKEEFVLNNSFENSKFKSLIQIISKKDLLNFKNDCIKESFQFDNYIFNKICFQYLNHLNQSRNHSVDSLFRLFSENHFNSLKIITIYIDQYSFQMKEHYFDHCIVLSDYTDTILKESIGNLFNFIKFIGKPNESNEDLSLNEWCRKFKQIRSLITNQMKKMSKELKDMFLKCNVVYSLHRCFPQSSFDHYIDELLELSVFDLEFKDFLIRLEPNGQLFLQEIINDLYLKDMTKESINILMSIILSEENALKYLSIPFRSYIFYKFLINIDDFVHKKEYISMIDDSLKDNPELVTNVIQQCFIKFYKDNDMSTLRKKISLKRQNFTHPSNFERILIDSLIHLFFTKISQFFNSTPKDKWETQLDDICLGLKDIEFDLDKQFLFLTYFDTRKIKELSAEKILQKLGVQVFKEVAEIPDQIFNSLPFMYRAGESKTIYESLKESFKNSKELKKKLNSLKDKNECKMMVLLICYHEFFSKNKKCDPLLQLIQDDSISKCLDLNPEELNCFIFYSNGPLENQIDESELVFAFSKNLFKDKNSDRKSADIMTNIIAVTLGMGRNTHLYARAFNPTSMRNTHSPGSCAGVPTDCGYQTNLDNTSSVYEMILSGNILNGSPLYHSALNTLTFGASSMCLLFDHKNEGMMVELAHRFSDYTKKISRLGKIQNYTKFRFDTFYQIFEHNLKDQNSVPPIFVLSHSLYLFYENVSQMKTASATFTNSNVVRQYENDIRDFCFKPSVDNSEDLLKELNSIIQQDEVVTKLDKLRMIRKQSELLSNAFPDMNLLQTAIASSNTTDANKINQFMNIVGGLEFLKELPFFVRFYDELFSKLDGQIKRDELTLPIIQVLKKYNFNLNTWEIFKTKWNNATDAIINAISILDEKFDCTEIFTSSLASDDKPLCIYIDEHKTKNSMKVLLTQMMTVHNTFPFRDTEMIKISCHIIPQGVSELVQFDFKNFNELINTAYQYDSGHKYNFDILIHMIEDATLKPLLDIHFKKIHTFEDESKIEKIQQYGFSHPKCVHNLHDSIQSIKHYDMFEERLKSRKFISYVDNLNSEVLLDLIKTLDGIIEYFKKSSDEFESTMKLSQLEIVKDNEKQFLFNLEFKDLISSSKYVLDKYLKLDSFEIPVLHEKIPIQSFVMNDLILKFENILENGEWLPKLLNPFQKILNVFSNSKELMNPLKFELSFYDSFKTEIEQEFNVQIESKQKDLLMKFFNIDGIKIKNAGPYLKFLNVSIGKLNLKIYENLHSKKTYCEKLHPDFGNQIIDEVIDLTNPEDEKQFNLLNSILIIQNDMDRKRESSIHSEFIDAIHVDFKETVLDIKIKNMSPKLDNHESIDIPKEFSDPISSPSTNDTTPKNIVEEEELLPEELQGNNVQNWNAEDVSVWISEINPVFVENGYDRYFIEEEIDGSALLEMTEKDLKDLGISKMGHRKNIIKKIKEL